MIDKINTKFPHSKVMIPQINVPPNLPKDGSNKLSEYNYFLSKQTKIEIIPKIQKEHFRLQSDGYHWTRDTANKLYNHWLDHLN